MADPVIIPTDTTGRAYYTQRTRLDGREFTLRFAWNQREERWYLSVLDSEEVLLVAGIKLVCNWPLLRYAQWDKRVPPGDLRVSALSANDSPPGFEDLGEGLRCELVYQPVTSG